MEELSFRVGIVKVDLEKIPYSPPGIPDNIKWVFVVPWEYNPTLDMKDRTVNCFTDTPRGIALMEQWLREHCLWRIYNWEDVIADVVNYMGTNHYRQRKNQYLKKAFKRLQIRTKKFLKLLAAQNISPSDANLFPTLNKPKILLDEPIIHSSLIYKAQNFGCGNPPTTNDVMYIENMTFVADMKNNAAPEWNTWAGSIGSARVHSGCLRLFTSANYGGIKVFLFGPNADYEVLPFLPLGAAWAYSLQMTP